MVRKKQGKGRHAGSLWIVLAIFFGALGFASLIQGILMQIDLGFKYGFYSYLLAFIFICIAKVCKYKAYSFSHTRVDLPKRKR